MKLTSIQCKTAKPQEKSYKLFDGQGLYLEIVPSGSKLWRLKYRIHKKEKRLALGRFPETSLADARKKREEARELISRNIDPVLQKLKDKSKSAAESEDTLEAVAREWFRLNKSKWSPSYADEVLHRLERDIFPEIGALPVQHIDAQILLRCIRKIEARGAPEVARRQLQKCGEIFQYAIGEGKIAHNPAVGLVKNLSPQQEKHYPALSIEEMPDFIKALYNPDIRLYPSTRNATALMMHTFVRTGELIGGRWEEINHDDTMWIIPPERMKMKQEHLVPLSRQSMAILDAQRTITGDSEFIFPSPFRPRQPLSNNAILSAIDDLGFKGRMTGHGFRTVAMTACLEQLNVAFKTIDRQLAHVEKSKTRRAYDRAEFIDERISMMQEYSDFLVRIASDERVIKFARPVLRKKVQQ